MKLLSVIKKATIIFSGDKRHKVSTFLNWILSELRRRGNLVRKITANKYAAMLDIVQPQLHVSFGI
jgi:hypothetical protein